MSNEQSNQAPEDMPPPPPSAPVEDTPPPAPQAAPAAPASQQPASQMSEKKLVAGLLAIILGSLGIHKFYLGYQKEGIIMLCITVLSCGFLAIVSSIIGIIEGIMYLTKTNEDFDRMYVVGRKPWF